MPDEEIHRAAGSLIWRNPERILDVVSGLKGEGATIECVLRGASMGAVIPKGSVVRILAGKSASHHVGEVVAFVRDSGICVHRVVYVGRGTRARDHVITQGDACLYPDAPVQLRNVLGTVTEFHWRGGWSGTLDQRPDDRAGSLVGRVLLAIVAGAMEINVKLAQHLARMLRIRKEGE